MPTKKLARAKRALNDDDVPRFVEEYLLQRQAADAMAAKVNEMKATLTTYLDQVGETDDKGHKFVDVETSRGTVHLRRERRVSRSLDERKAAAWLKEHGLLKRCQTTTVVLDEDKIMALNYEDPELLDDATLAGFFETREIWAFKANV